MMSDSAEMNSVMGDGCVAAIELRDVTKKYAKEDVLALDCLSLTVRKGEFVSITGPSGSGKSTLLHIAGGIEVADSGSVFVYNQAVETASHWTRIRSDSIGYIFQAFHLLPTLTAVENVEIPLHGQLPGAKKRRDRALSLLRHVGLEKRKHHLPSELSGGEQQRVAIARSLANSPSILLADEPTGNLDSKTSKEILALFQEIHRTNAMTVILVTHEQDIAEISTRNVQMVDGRIVSDRKLVQ